MRIKRIKLNAISAENLRQKEMNAIIGGDSCGCGCAYEEQNGGASTDANMHANYNYGYESNSSCNFTQLMDEYYWLPVCRPQAS